MGTGEQDPLYDDALRIVTESRRASISLIQRRLKIGYNRAARIMEEMEAAGVVSTMDTSGSREVLAPSSTDYLIYPEFSDAKAKTHILLNIVF